jgi:DNA-binding transcriptional MocR family regulator
MDKIRAVSWVHRNLRGFRWASSASSAGSTSAAAEKGGNMFQQLKPGPLKKLYKYYTVDAVNFAGGVPMDSTFPIDRIRVSGEAGEFEVKREDSTLMLNYHRGTGLPFIREWTQAHVTRLHNRSNFDCCMTVGSTDAFAKILMLLNGDTVMFDEYAYGASVGASSLLGRTNVGVKMDWDGMLPEELHRQTKLARAKGLRPDIVYLDPESQNPTGISMTQKRKKEIYEVCQELDLVIIEDGKFNCLATPRVGHLTRGIV